MSCYQNYAHGWAWTTLGSCSGLPHRGHEPVEASQIRVDGDARVRQRRLQPVHDAAGLRRIDLQRDGAIWSKPERELIDQPVDEVEPRVAAVQRQSRLGNEIAVAVDLVRSQI